jgi:solute carrier family 35, member E3
MYMLLLQGWSLLLVGPFLDYYVVDAWVLEYDWRMAAAIVFGSSCALAVLVNLSQFMCLGRFTAVSYQVGQTFTQTAIQLDM